MKVSKGAKIGNRYNQVPQPCLKGSASLSIILHGTINFSSSYNIS